MQQIEYVKTFHLNISSLFYHCLELQSLLSGCGVNFEMIGIAKSRLKRNQMALQKIEIPNYRKACRHLDLLLGSTLGCPTEGLNGGTLIYIKNDIIHKVKSDLKIY